MSKESYIRGFCKAAEAAGVDPGALAKYAADTSGAIMAQQKSLMADIGELFNKEVGPQLGIGKTVHFSPGLQKLVSKYQSAYGKEAAESLLSKLGDEYTSKSVKEAASIGVPYPNRCLPQEMGEGLRSKPLGKDLSIPSLFPHL